MTTSADLQAVALTLDGARAFWAWFHEEIHGRDERRRGVPESHAYRYELRQEAKELGKLQWRFREHWARAQAEQPAPEDVDRWSAGLGPAATRAFSLVLRQGIVNAREDVRRSHRADRPASSTETEDAEALELVYQRACDRFHALIGCTAAQLQTLDPTAPPPKRPLYEVTEARVVRVSESGSTPEQHEAALRRFYELIGEEPPAPLRRKPE